MAIPGTPQNFIVQTGNRQNLITCDLSTGATSYIVQRSTDGVTFATLSSPSSPTYTDNAVTAGTQYWYQMAASNSSGTSAYTAPFSIVPAPTSEMSLLTLRRLSQDKADRVNSDFVTTSEWNSFINLALYELYDLLITNYENYNVAIPITWISNGTTFLYTLPDGITTFTNRLTNSTITAAPFYKLLGVDLGINSSSNAYVSINNFNFIDRNRFVYPNTASTIYGVFNLQYQLVGNQIMFIPTPSSGQVIGIWYIPRLPELLADTDLTTIGVSGWLQYVICRAAKYALDKEESDTTKLDQELLFMKTRIEETAMNRDAGMPARISDVRQNGWWGSGSGGYGSNGPMGGF